MPDHNIKKVVIIGSGVMGSGIASLIANRDTSVTLMDITTDHEDKDILAKRAIDKLVKTKALADYSNINYIHSANLDDDLSLIDDADWVIEAVSEDLEIKKSVYERIAPHCSSNTVITSNTSTIKLDALLSVAPANIRKVFFITHFFNPPRYMSLLEVVYDKQITDQTHYQTIIDFAERELGRETIICKDSAGFIANRIGCFWIFNTIALAVKHNLRIDEADFILHKYMNIPKTGVFSLVDIIGLDLIVKIADSLKDLLPSDDLLTAIEHQPPVIMHLLEQGFYGRKTKQGFYRKNNKQKQVFSAQDNDYYDCTKFSVSQKSLLDDRKYYPFLSEVIFDLLYYSSKVAREIASNIYDIDNAMKAGYNWKLGVFELFDYLQAQNVGLRNQLIAHCQKSYQEIPALIKNSTVFYQNNQLCNLEGNLVDSVAVKYMRLQDYKANIVVSNRDMDIYYLDRDIYCLTLKSKMNTLTPKVFEGINEFIDGYPNCRGLIIYSDQEYFSVGADISVFESERELAEQFIVSGQRVFNRLKYTDYPVISAVRGFALGGGCELLMHSDVILAHVNSCIGLVELNLGLIPAFGGCKELVLRYIQESNVMRNKGFIVKVANLLNILAEKKVSRSIYEAMSMNIIDKTKVHINKNTRYLLQEAYDLCCEISDDYVPEQECDIYLEYHNELEGIMQQIDDLHDYERKIINQILVIFASRGLNSDNLLRKECNIFFSLFDNTETRGRIEKFVSKI